MDCTRKNSLILLYCFMQVNKAINICRLCRKWYVGLTNVFVNVCLQLTLNYTVYIYIVCLISSLIIEAHFYL